MKTMLYLYGMCYSNETKNRGQCNVRTVRSQTWCDQNCGRYSTDFNSYILFFMQGPIQGAVFGSLVRLSHSAPLGAVCAVDQICSSHHAPLDSLPVVSRIKESHDGSHHGVVKTRFEHSQSREKDICSRIICY